MRRQYVIVTLILFIWLTAVFFAMRAFAPGYDVWALEGGNMVMAALALSAYFIVRKQIDNRPAAFVRGVYSASLLKLMVCMVSILVYVLLNREHIHKSTIFMLFGIYAIYTAAESILLSKMARQEK